MCIRDSPNISTVFRQKGPVQGSYRLRNLEFLAGEYKTLTIHKEYGCRFYVDVLRTYYSPRLSTERWRITNLTNKDEVVVNMFAGVGPFSIMIAKYRQINKIYSIDINYDAVRLHRENIKLNKVSNIEVLLGDAGEIIYNKLVNSCDRVLMPLPEYALEYLDAAISALRNKGWIHIYLHVPYIKEEQEAVISALNIIEKEITKRQLRILDIKAKRVREIATRTLQVCVDVLVLKRLSYEYLNF